MISNMSLSIPPRPGERTSTPFRILSLLPEQHWLNTEVLRPWALEASSRSGGELDVQISYQAGLDALDRVLDGRADAALTIAGYTAERFGLTSASALPGVAPSAPAAVSGIWNVYREIQEVRDEFEGLLPLALFTTTGMQLWTSTRELASIEAVAGLKIHLSGAITISIANALNARPVVAPVSSAQEMLRESAADAIFLSASGVSDLQLASIGYGLLLPGGFSKAPFVLVANEAFMTCLSATARQALELVSGETLSASIAERWEARDRAALTEVRATVAVSEDPKVAAAIERRLRGTVIPAWVGGSELRVRVLQTFREGASTPRPPFSAACDAHSWLSLHRRSRGT